jgi:hypothetical protein
MHEKELLQKQIEIRDNLFRMFNSNIHSISISILGSDEIKETVNFLSLDLDNMKNCFIDFPEKTIRDFIENLFELYQTKILKHQSHEN